MNAHRTLLLIILVFCGSLLNAQELTSTTGDNPSPAQLFSGKSELYFRFLIRDKKEIGKLTRIISIDNVKGDTVWAYANRKQFPGFLQSGYEYKILPNPGDLIHPRMLDNVNLKDRTVWDFYPTYSAYLSLMSPIVGR